MTEIRKLAVNTIKKLREIYFPAYGTLCWLITACSVHDAIKSLETSLANQSLSDQEILVIFKQQLSRVEKTSEMLSNKENFIKLCYEFIDAANLKVNQQADQRASATLQPLDYRHGTQQEFSMDKNLLMLANDKGELKVTEYPSNRLIGHIFQTVYIWDARTGALLHTLHTKHDGIAKLLPISNTRLVTVGEYGDVCIWDLPSNTLHCSIREKNYDARAQTDRVVKLSNGQFAIATIHKPIEIWDSNGVKLTKMKIKASAHRKFTYLEMIPLDNNRLLAALSDISGKPCVCVWDTTSGKCLKEIETPFEVQTAIPRPDGTVLIYNRFQNEAGILDIELEEVISLFDDSMNKEDRSVFAALSSRYLLTTLSANDGSSAIDSHEIFIRDLFTDQEYPLSTPNGQPLTQEQIIDCQFNPKHPDALFISYYSAYQKSALLIYDVTTGQLLHQQAHVQHFKLLSNQSLLRSIAGMNHPYGGRCTTLQFPSTPTLSLLNTAARVTNFSP